MPPSAADYQILTDQLIAAVQSFTAGEIDFRTFRQHSDAIRANLGV